MLYKQTAIKPVVYLILIDKMNEYKKQLQQQDNGTFVEKVLPSEEPKTTSEQTATNESKELFQQQDNGTLVEKVIPSEEQKTTKEQTATKNNSDMNLSGLKKLF